MGTVIVLGSIITDLVARAPRLPLPGESLIGDEFALFLGGKGINQAIMEKSLDRWSRLFSLYIESGFDITQYTLLELLAQV